MRLQLFAFYLCLSLFTQGAAASLLYVDLNSTNPLIPYSTWDTAATNIQDAVDAASTGDLVVVSNGVYNFGARSLNSISNRVVITNAITLRSTSGRDATVINGDKGVRCIYLSDGAVLDGFTLTNGFVSTSQGGGAFCQSTNALIFNSLIVSNTSSYGGGVIYGSLSNCVIFHNISSGSGGGAESCIANHCGISNNFAGFLGGGVSGLSILNNCVLSGNQSVEGGSGAFGSTLNNCLIIGNQPPGSYGGSGALNCNLNSCTVCSNGFGFAVENGGVPTSPTSNFVNNCIIYYNVEPYDGFSILASNNCIPPNVGGGYPGINTITNPPLFVNPSIGDYHLLSNSPCINSGKSAFATWATDFDGNPRVVGGTVDMGAFEFQQPASVLSYGWAQKYGLALDGSADFSDPDSDGMNNWQEWVAGTNPTNAASLLKINSLSNSVSGVKVTWQSVTNINYFLQRATDFSQQPSFSTIQSNIAGRANSTSFFDVGATNGNSFFYRIGVQQ